MNSGFCCLFIAR